MLTRIFNNNQSSIPRDHTGRRSRRAINGGQAAAARQGNAEGGESREAKAATAGSGSSNKARGDGGRDAAAGGSNRGSSRGSSGGSSKGGGFGSVSATAAAATASRGRWTRGEESERVSERVSGHRRRRGAPERGGDARCKKAMLTTRATRQHVEARGT